MSATWVAFFEPELSRASRRPAGPSRKRERIAEEEWAICGKSQDSRAHFAPGACGLSRLDSHKLNLEGRPERNSINSAKLSIK